MRLTGGKTRKMSATQNVALFHCFEFLFNRFNCELLVRFSAVVFEVLDFCF